MTKARIVEWVDSPPPPAGGDGTKRKQITPSSSMPVWIVSLMARPGDWAVVSINPKGVSPYRALYPSVEFVRRGDMVYARWPKDATPWWEDTP